VGRAFVAFTVALAAALGGVWYESANPLSPSSAPEQLGMVATTVFTLAGISVLYRAASTHTTTLVPVAVVLFGTGAWWCWSAFVNGQPIDRFDQPGPGSIVTTLTVLVSAVVGALLLAEGMVRARWLGVFTGLGMVGLTLVATAVRVEPDLVTTVSLPLAATVAGMACLYGSLVEIEASERRSIDQLAKAKARVESEIAATEELLHDLRNGLLSIEAAMGAVDSDLAGPLRSEAARLRRLTTKRERVLTEFDLLPGLRELAKARRAGGAVLDLRLPGEARVIGDESEVVAIVDNLVANAHRHGTGPIEIDVLDSAGSVCITVSDLGPASGGIDPNLMFTRGYSSHPDGEGVGLSRSRLLAQANNGSVRFARSENGKTSFVLTIPAAERSPENREVSSTR
jgi:signal transduction histidine kinase